MKNWDTLEADVDRILTKHFTSGRAGRKIRMVVVHHNGGRLDVDGCWQTWQTRQASAHYQVCVDGTIGQLVWDRDTAWHAANGEANRTSIGIEHADETTNPWHISDATLDNGAHLVAAICKYYGLGRPEWMVNVFPHSHFSSTECPASIAGDQNAAYMQRAQQWYDSMVNGADVPAQVPQAAPAAPQDDGRLAVDGSCGPATIRKWQQVMGTTVDGVISGQLVPNQRTYWRPALPTSCVTYGGYGSELIRRVQAQLGQGQDGLLGPGTIRAIQAHLGVAQDASFGPATVRALQTRLNENRF
ncbi:N-acetylmuramoyl-L-alanine amidase [Bifidobacterium tissieri]|uniref:peptidoglycan recognition protein family protein n=1 Tax=Bifidobacterium tissieri TaxID=1630162 RepID=UPI001CC279CA|nr:peptidoglycan-binding domain-containing protein [Bifidobacterium tissieri]